MEFGNTTYGNAPRQSSGGHGALRILVLRTSVPGFAGFCKRGPDVEISAEFGTMGLPERRFGYINLLPTPQS